MISFSSDYITGAHPEVLQRLLETNAESLPGYGSDKYTLAAEEKIRAACGKNDADVCLLTGGTMTNQLVIDTMLKGYEGVVAADTGHVSVHEAGAIEFTGHKVIQTRNVNGKIVPDDLESLLSGFFSDENHEHMVFPGLVYLSYPTEYGTVYSKKELSDIYGICVKYGVRLYIDGARLGYGLMRNGSDLTLPDLVSLCDVFYIGGTKAGALCGEAVVFTHGNMPDHFVTRVKQHGDLLAKGRLLGVQFDALFTDGLYFRICRHAIEMADELKKVLSSKGL